MSDFNDFDDINYPRTEDSQFSELLDRAISRRGFLNLGAAFGVTAFVSSVGGVGNLAYAKAGDSKLMGFKNIPMSIADTITLPEGYSWKLLAAWGDPLFPNGTPFDQQTRGTGESQELAYGDNNDGMSLFQLSEDHGVFVVNDERFDVSKHPNEPNRAGYIVEIDPMSPNSKPKKRTALGRFKHENAEVTLAKDERVVVYLGNDERGEFLYRYVSDGKFIEGDTNNNARLLDWGTLYVAKFSEADDMLSGKGEWVALKHGENGLTEENGFASQAEVLIHARMAGSAVGATTMDRPEWVAVNPNKTEAYCALTNNKNRAVKPNAGGDEARVGGPNPRVKNLYGQIVRWAPAGDDHAADTFNWDLFVLAGNPAAHPGSANRGSANITVDNMFNSPDGIMFDKDGRFWIQTDGNYSNKEDFVGMGNNQMLCADPASGEIRRFLVGPVACEVTGAAWTEDGKTMFVGIQHPGEKKNGSHFPDGGDSVPRSSIVVITKDDGGVIGA